MLGLGAALLVLFLLQSQRGAERATREAEQLTQALALGLADQVARTIEPAEVLLTDIATRHADRQPQSLSPAMGNLARDMPQLRALAVADAQGRITEANAEGLLGRELGGRAWFRALWERPGHALALGPPEPGRLLDGVATPWPARWTLPVARPLRDAEGNFAGAAIALLNAEYLTALAARQAEALDVIVRLYTFDGVLVARGDAALAGIGAAHPTAWPFARFLPRREVGMHSGPDGFAAGGFGPGGMGTEVSAGFALTRQLPLVVEVAQRREVALAGVRDQDMVFLGAIGAVALLALAAVLVVLRQGRRLAASEREARAASEAKQEFLASMSHEIRTPVSGVIGLSELLMETRLSPMQRRYAETINNSAAHLLTLLNDILDFSKLEAGAAAPEAVAFRIEQQLGTIVELFAPRAAAKNVELVCVIGPGVPERVRGDPARFRQILFNLVGNAVKFTETGWIRLSVAATPAAGNRCDLVCTVSDTGIGIDPARIPALFDRFSQADASIRRRYGGTGLGLAISLRLAELLGGTIEAAPRPGGGSVFRLLLNLAAMPEEERPSPLAGKRALVIEETALQRGVLAQQLEALRLIAITAATLEEGLAPAPEAGFDVVILGARLGALDAVEAAYRVRDRMGEGPRLIRFGQPDPAAPPLPFGLFQAILLKPVLPGRLQEALSHAFRLGAAGQDAPGAPAQGAPAAPVAGFPGAAAPGHLGAAAPGPPAGTTPDQPGAAPQAQHAPPRRALRVLLAEDNPVNQFMLRRMLEGAGATVEVAADGAAAVRSATAAAFDAIIMDMQMPEMDGLEATRAIRAGGGPNAAVPIIGLTAAVGQDHALQCEAAGMNLYMTKPVDRAVLLRQLGLG